MEHIDAGIVRYVAVLDLLSTALIVHIVGQAGDDQVSPVTTHQQRESFRLGAVIADGMGGP